MDLFGKCIHMTDLQARSVIQHHIAIKAAVQLMALHAYQLQENQPGLVVK